MRGLPFEEAKQWAADGQEESVVLWLREESRGGGERQREEVRGLRPEGAKPGDAIGWEAAAVVQGLRAGGGAHGPFRLEEAEAVGDRPSSLL